MNPANVDFLVGRSFASNGGNIAAIRRIGPGAMRVVWATKPTSQDESDFDKWAASLLEAHLGADIEITTCGDGEDEDAAYREWLKK